ncbi:hypothetical protein CHUAL_001165 [Chamberlinius hualienensis]
MSKHSGKADRSQPPWMKALLQHRQHENKPPFRMVITSTSPKPNIVYDSKVYSGANGLSRRPFGFGNNVDERKIVKYQRQSSADWILNDQSGEMIIVNGSENKMKQQPEKEKPGPPVERTLSNGYSDFENEFDSKYPYTPGLVGRLKEKFSSLALQSVPISPQPQQQQQQLQLQNVSLNITISAKATVRRAASLEMLLDNEDERLAVVASSKSITTEDAWPRAGFTTVSEAIMHFSKGLQNARGPNKSIENTPTSPSPKDFFSKNIIIIEQKPTEKSTKTNKVVSTDKSKKHPSPKQKLNVNVSQVNNTAVPTSVKETKKLFELQSSAKSGFSVVKLKTDTSPSKPTSSRRQKSEEGGIIVVQDVKPVVKMNEPIKTVESTKVEEISHVFKQLIQLQPAPPPKIRRTAVKVPQLVKQEPQVFTDPSIRVVDVVSIETRTKPEQEQEPKPEEVLKDEILKPTVVKPSQMKPEPSTASSLRFKFDEDSSSRSYLPIREEVVSPPPMSTSLPPNVKPPNVPVEEESRPVGRKTKANYVIFINANVIVGKSSILKNRNKKVIIIS